MGLRLLLPFDNVDQKNVKFELSEACEKIFQLLKNRLTSDLVFTLAEGTKVSWYIVMHPKFFWGMFLCNVEKF